MSKELEALQDLINFIGNGEIANTHELCEYVAKRKDIIETALKDKENIEIALKNAEDRHKRAKWANNKIEQSLISIIEEKMKSAESQLLGNHDLDKRERLKGEIEAYYDVICLIKFKYGIEK